MAKIIKKSEAAFEHLRSVARPTVRKFNVFDEFGADARGGDAFKEAVVELIEASRERIRAREELHRMDELNLVPSGHGWWSNRSLHPLVINARNAEARVAAALARFEV